MRTASAFALALLATVLSNVEATAAPTTAVDVAAQELIEAAADSRIVVLGELHGTREVPELATVLAKRYAEQGPLVLAMEVSQSEQRSLERSITAPNGQWREELRQRRYWRMAPERSDGRRNEQLLDVVEALRLLRASGREVAVLAFDPRPGGSPGSAGRERDMAASLRAAYAALPRGRILVITGNFHARAYKRADAPPELPDPMASHLADLQPYLVDVTARQGHFRACLRSGQCGPLPAHGIGRSGPLSRGASEAYDYRVVLERFTPATLIPP